MSVAGLYLYDIGKLAEKLSNEFGALPYEKFTQDTKKIESAVMRLLIMKEGWIWLPRTIRQELALIDWRAVTGKWDRKAGRHVGFDPKQLWETIVEKLPEVSRKVEDLLKRQNP
jgi:uncharacterized protein with HEPN domain